MAIFLPLLAAGGSAIASGIQNLINAKRQSKNIALQNTQSSKLADMQYSRDVDMWNKQNAYNSPSAQMQRFKDAGLNKALIYSQGSSGLASQLPRYSAPTWAYDYAPSVNLPQMLSAGYDAGNKWNQVQAGQIKKHSYAADANIKSFILKNMANEFFTNWGTDPTNFENSMKAQLMRNLLGQSNLALEKTSTDIQSELQRQTIRDMDIQFSKMGGPFFNPVLKFLQMIMGGLK